MGKEQIQGAVSNGLTALITAFFDGIIPFAKEYPFEFLLYGIAPLILMWLSGEFTWIIFASFFEEKLRKVYNSFPSKIVSWLAPLALGFVWCSLCFGWVIPADFDMSQATKVEIGVLLLKLSVRGLVVSAVVLLVHFVVARCLDAHKEKMKEREKFNLEENLREAEDKYTDAYNKFHKIARKLTDSIAQIDVNLRKSCKNHFEELMEAHNHLLQCEKERTECKMKVDGYRN